MRLTREKADMLILGLDPGLSGAIAILDEQTVHLLVDMPVHKIGVGHKKGTRPELDLHSFCGFLSQHRPDHCIIEKVSARPGQGVTSMFRFGYAAGAVYGAIAALGLPCSFVAPQSWQKFHSVGPSADAARQRATQLYPQLAPQLAKKRDCNRADAVLIACYGLHRLWPEVRQAA
jgi:crossover junction endodeoxyribonuclease RuvC